MDFEHIQLQFKYDSKLSIDFITQVVFCLKENGYVKTKIIELLANCQDAAVKRVFQDKQIKSFVYRVFDSN